MYAAACNHYLIHMFKESVLMNTGVTRIKIIGTIKAKLTI